MRIKNWPSDQVVEIWQEHFDWTSSLKRPIIVDEDDLQVGYNTDDISIFLPQELRSLDCDICESSNTEINFDENLKEELKKIKD